jgi:hypothetical protein
MEPGIGLDERHRELILSETTSTRNWLRIKIGHFARDLTRR